MPLPKSKSELLSRLRETYSKLDTEFDEISLKQSRVRKIQGDVSACDVLAYQIGWGRLLLNWEITEKNGHFPDMPAKGYKWNELGKIAKSFYDESKDDSLIKLRKKFQTTVTKIDEMIEGMDEKELFSLHQRAWAGSKWPVAKWIQVNTIAPYSSARTKVRKWKKGIEAI